MATLLAFALACLGTARGQAAPAGPLHRNPNAPPEQPASNQQKHPIRTQVNVVTAPVIVRDAKTGEMVLDLTKDDFHVYDNGLKQRIDHFDLGGDSLSIVLAIQTSARVGPVLPGIRKSGIVFTHTVMGQTAEAAVLGYAQSVDLLENFTTDVDDVQKTINELKIGTAGQRLYDAMSRGISMLEERPLGQRRILIVIGEAHDSGSENALGAVLRHAQLANVTICAVGLSTTALELSQPAGQFEPPISSPPATQQAGAPPPTAGNLGALLIWLVKTGKNAVGSNSLEIATQATGGLQVGTARDREIQTAVDKIGGELHAGYVIGYHPPGDEPSGYHEIKVTVDRKNVKVRTRPGYYIPPPEQ